MQRFLIVFTVLSFFLLGSCSIISPSAQTDPEPFSVRVMSYNIRVGAGSKGEYLRGEELKENLRQIAAYIRESGADVVLLQEVDRFAERSAEVDQPRFLADLLGYEWAFTQALERSGGQYGIAVLSRWPIRDTSSIKLFKPDYSQSNPDWPDWYGEQRVAMVATIASPQGKFAVLDTHLGITEDQRVKQFAQVVELAVGVPDRMPLIIGGDFNAEPEEPGLMAMRLNFTDAYEAAEPPVAVADRLTYPTVSPDRCIDYLFYRADTARVRDIQVGDVEWSDHRPVIADFDVYTIAE